MTCSIRSTRPVSGNVASPEEMIVNACRSSSKQAWSVDSRFNISFDVIMNCSGYRIWYGEMVLPLIFSGANSESTSCVSPSIGCSFVVCIDACCAILGRSDSDVEEECCVEVVVKESATEAEVRARTASLYNVCLFIVRIVSFTCLRDRGLQGGKLHSLAMLPSFKNSGAVEK